MCRCFVSRGQRKLFAMEIYLRIDSRDPPTGRLVSGPDHSVDGRPFSGWLDLLRILGDVLSDVDGEGLRSERTVDKLA